MTFSILFMLTILISSMFTAYLPASAAETQLQILEPNNSNQDSPNDENNHKPLQNNEISDAVSKEKIVNSIIKTKLPFVENQGQVNDQVKYYVETFAGTVYVTESDLLYYSVNKDSAKAIAIKEKFLDGTLSLSGIDKSSAIVNYFKGTQENWKTGIPTYDSVSLGKVWPNIDVQLKAYGNNVEKIFTVHPQGNVSDIRLTFDGINDLSVSENEELVVNTFLGQMFLSKPVAYQEIDGKRYDVDISYRIIGSNTYGFSTLSYDPRYDLVIDPLIASTFIGGTGYDSSYSVALDGLGNVYITGETQDAVTLFPTTPGVYDVSYNSYDVFVSKFNPDLSSLLASTFVGGTGIDVGYDVALDGLGNVYVVGETCCTTSGFPTTLGAYDTTQNGSVDVFVSKFNPDLSSLLASTFVGGASNDVAKTIDLDDSGNVYIAGQTNAVFQMYPTTSGAYDTTENGNSEAFVSKFNPALSSLVASTFLGGTGSDSASGIIVDSVGNVYVTGSTRPPTFPSNSPSTFPTMFGSYDTTYNGGTDAFVSKFNAHLSVLLSSTLIGGSGSDNGAKLAIDNSGNVYVAGGTTSLSFPTTLGAYDTTYNGGTDAFVSKLDANLLNLFASSLIGGTNYDEIYDMSIDSSNNVYVTGGTDATDFPTTSNAYDSTHNGNFDAFITKFNSGLSDLLTSTFVGNAGYDESRGIAFDNTGNVYVAGGVDSLSFPTTPGAYDTTHNGDFDAFVSKFSFGDHITDVTITSISPTIVRQGVQTTITAQVIDLTSPSVPPGEILFSDNGAGGEFNTKGFFPCIGSIALPLPKTCTVNYIPNTSGTITITATYDQPGYVANHDSGDLIVEPPIGTIVTFVDPPTHIAIGQNVNLVINVAADTLAVLPTGKPTLSDNALGEFFFGACFQDAPNAIKCNYNYHPNDANPPGERVTLTAVYDVPGFVRSEKSVDVIVNLDKTTTRIISIDPPNVAPGDTVTIIANVVDDTSHIYPTGDLTFSDGGAGGNFENLSCIDSSTQDNLRQCVVFYTTNPAGQQDSTVNIVASYSEPQFTPSNDSKQILIQDNRIPTTMEMLSLSHSIPSSGTFIEAFVHGTKEKPISGTVEFSDSGAGGTFSGFKCTQNSPNLYCIVSYKPSLTVAAGTRITFTGSYAGSDDYMPSAAPPQTVKLVLDTDGDGISDDDETEIHHTNPNSADTDGDGISDSDELFLHFTNPKFDERAQVIIEVSVTPSMTSQGGRITGTATNVVWPGMLKFSDDVGGDFRDLTCESSVHCYANYVPPANVLAGTKITITTSFVRSDYVLSVPTTITIDLDTDGDGISDNDEINRYHTNPNSIDTDGDGFDDKFEIINGFNPNLEDSELATFKANIHVDNTGGGTALPSDFELVLDGNLIIAGNMRHIVSGDHTLAPAHVYELYPTVLFSGDCDSGGVIHVSAYQDATCTVTFVYRDNRIPTTTVPFSQEHAAPLDTIKIDALVDATDIAPTGEIIFSDGGAGGSFSSVSCKQSASNTLYCETMYSAPASITTDGWITITASYQGNLVFKPSQGYTKLLVLPWPTSTSIFLDSYLIEPGASTGITIFIDTVGDFRIPTSTPMLDDGFAGGIFSQISCGPNPAQSGQLLCSSSYTAPTTLHSTSTVITALYPASTVFLGSVSKAPLTFDIPNTIKVDSLSGPIEFTSSMGALTSIVPVLESSLPTQGKPLLTFQFGFFDYTIYAITPGSTMELQITYPQNIPAEAEYWQVRETEWTDLTYLLGNSLQDGDNKITLHLTDGGPGDTDGQINGQITDPAGIGMPVVYCDGRTIAQLLATPSYNVIDNRDSHLGAKIKGTNGNDLILLSDISTKVSARQGNDCVIGGSGNDQISGGKGNDQIFGNGGNDKISGNDGDDRLNGGDDDDRIWGGKGSDNINVGDGNDRAHGNQDADTISGGDGNDWLGAGIGDDTVTGGLGDDKIFGRQGNDNLSGNEGMDRIHGGQGNDALNGGSGEPDRCHGGQGTNTFAECEITKGDMAEEEDLDDEVEE